MMKMAVNKLLNPFWCMLFLAFVAILAVLGLPENIAAYIICLFFLAIVILHPLNGIYFLLLVIPFFLGNSKRPYYFMLEFFIYITIFSAIFHHALRKKIKTVPYAYLILLFCAASLCSLPLNLKELFCDIWARPPLESLQILASSHEGFNLYYVRTLLNLASGVLLYFVTVSVLANYKDAKKIFKPMAIMALITVIFGFLFFYNVIPHSGRYLGLSLVGKHANAMTAFAYNRGYLGQYLIVSLPFVAFFLSGWKNHRILSFAFLVIAVVCISGIAFTLQRGPLIAFIAEVFLFLILYWYLSDRKRRAFFLSFGIIIGILAVFLLTDHFFVGGKGLSRLMTGGFDYRGQLWKASSQMFLKNPLLGIGLGKHHYFFPEYAELVGIPWRSAGARTTAHNVYLHLLAEQGIVGFGCFILLVGTIFITTFRKLRIMTREHRAIAVAIMVSLCGWLTFGLSQHMFYLRSMQVFFWIMLGFLAVILRQYVQPSRISKKILIISSICLLILFSCRVFIVARYPFPEKYYVGFYDWELQPDGARAHWMGKRAAMRIPVEGEELILKCKTALPDLHKKPQKVYVASSSGYSTQIILKNQDCVEIKIPVGKISAFMWVKLRTDYVLIPSKQGWSKDTRPLGVMFHEVKWAPLGKI